MSSSFFKKDIIYINSKFRTGGTSSDFTIDLSKQIRNVSNDYNSISLLNFSCPKSYYLFNNNNNTFTLTESKSVTVTIPIGNYKTSQLLSQLRTSIAAVATWTYTITYNSQLAKFTFVVSGNGGVQPSFDFSANNGCNDILGFNASINVFTADTITSSNMVNLQFTSTIQLMSDIVRGNVLSVIIPNVQDFSNIQYNENNPDFSAHLLNIKTPTSAKFWLLDSDGDPLDINGLDFSFTFAMFKSNDYYEKILNDKKISNYIDQLKIDGAN